MLSHQRSANTLFHTSNSDSRPRTDYAPPVPMPLTSRDKSSGKAEMDFDLEGPKHTIPNIPTNASERSRQFSHDALPKRPVAQVNRMLLQTSLENTGLAQKKGEATEDALIKRVKRELEMIFEEYRLSKISLIRVETAMAAGELFEGMLELLRVCLSRHPQDGQFNKSGGSLAATSETDKEKAETAFLRETN